MLASFLITFREALEAALSFVAVFREGVETVLFLGTLAVFMKTD